MLAIMLRPIHESRKSRACKALFHAINDTKLVTYGSGQDSTLCRLCVKENIQGPFSGVLQRKRAVFKGNDYSPPDKEGRIVLYREAFLDSSRYRQAGLTTSRPAP